MARNTGLANCRVCFKMCFPPEVGNDSKSDPKQDPRGLTAKITRVELLENYLFQTAVRLGSPQILAVLPLFLLTS